MIGYNHHSFHVESNETFWVDKSNCAEQRESNINGIESFVGLFVCSLIRWAYFS